MDGHIKTNYFLEHYHTSERNQVWFHNIEATLNWC